MTVFVSFRGGFGIPVNHFTALISQCPKWGGIVRDGRVGRAGNRRQKDRSLRVDNVTSIGVGLPLNEALVIE